MEKLLTYGCWSIRGPSAFFHSSKRPKVQALFLFLWEVSLQILLSKRLELESSIFSVFVLHSKRGLCLQPRWLEEIWVGQIWSHYQWPGVSKSRLVYVQCNWLNSQCPSFQAATAPKKVHSGTRFHLQLVICFWWQAYIAGWLLFCFLLYRSNT